MRNVAAKDLDGPSGVAPKIDIECTASIDEIALRHYLGQCAWVNGLVFEPFRDVQHEFRTSSGLRNRLPISKARRPARGVRHCGRIMNGDNRSFGGQPPAHVEAR